MQSQIHQFLTDQGAYTHTHIDAEFDDGDAENGPGTWGHDEYDIYMGDSHEIIFQHGKFIEMVLIQPHWNEPDEEYDFDPAPKYDGF